MANNRTGHNPGQIKKLDRVNKALAKAMDLTGSTAHSDALDGTDVFLMQKASGNVPAKKVTAALMQDFFSKPDVSDADGDLNMELVFVSGAGDSRELFVDDGTFKYNPNSNTFSLKSGSSANAVVLTAAGAISGSSTLKAGGIVTFGNGLFTVAANGNVDINGGAIDGTTIGAAVSSSIKATTISGSGLLSVAAGIQAYGLLAVTGAITGSSTITADGNIESRGSFVIGNASIDETDLEKLDDITNGTGAANKALVLSAARDIGNINNLTASAIQVDTLDVNTINSVTTTEQVLEVTDKLIVAAAEATSANANLGGLAIGTGSVYGRASGGGGYSAPAYGAIHWSNTTSSLDVVISGSKVAHFASSSAGGPVFNVTGSILASGSVSTIHGFTGEGHIKLPGAEEAVIDPDQDHLYFRDNGDGTVRRDSVLDVVKAGLNRVVVQHVFTLSSSAHSLSTASAGYPSSGSTGFVANVTSSALTIPVETFSSDVITGSFEVYLNGQLQTRSGSVSSANTPYFDYFLQATGSSKTAVVFENLNSGLELDHDDVVIVKYIVR